MQMIFSTNWASAAADTKGKKKKSADSIDCTTMHDKLRPHVRLAERRSSPTPHICLSELGCWLYRKSCQQLLFRTSHISLDACFSQIAATILVLESLLNKKLFMKNWVALGHPKNDYKSLKIKNDPGICCCLENFSRLSIILREHHAHVFAHRPSEKRNKVSRGYFEVTQNIHIL